MESAALSLMSLGMVLDELGHGLLREVLLEELRNKVLNGHHRHGLHQRKNPRMSSPIRWSSQPRRPSPTSRLSFFPEAFLPKSGPLSSGTQFSHLRRGRRVRRLPRPLSSGSQLSHLPRGRRVRRLPPPQASRCSQPPENPQHWGQGSHHVDDHPLGPQHWGQGSHHVADHPLVPPATSSSVQ